MLTELLHFEHCHSSKATKHLCKTYTHREKKFRKWVYAHCSGSFKANVELPKVPSMFLYIIHMDMVLNSKISLV